MVQGWLLAGSLQGGPEPRWPPAGGPPRALGPPGPPGKPGENSGGVAGAASDASTFQKNYSY